MGGRPLKRLSAHRDQFLWRMPPCPKKRDSDAAWVCTHPSLGLILMVQAFSLHFVVRASSLRPAGRLHVAIVSENRQIECRQSRFAAKIPPFDAIHARRY